MGVGIGMPLYNCPVCDYPNAIPLFSFERACESCGYNSPMREWYLATKSAERLRDNGGEKSMVLVSSVYTGNYLNASTLKSEGLVGRLLTIVDTTVEQLGRSDNIKDKIVLIFKETNLRLPLNGTNSQILVEVFGDETETWKQKTLTLQITRRQFQGQLVPAIEVVPNLM